MPADTITIIQGEDFTLNLAFTTAGGQPYSLLGCSVSLIVQKDAQSSAELTKTIQSHTDPMGGLTAIPLSHIDTDIAIRAWEFKIVLVDSSGSERPSGVHTFLVTQSGSTTDSVAVSIGSNSVTVALSLAGAAGPGVSTGGTAGQVLTKNTDTNFDTAWETPALAPVSSVAGRVGAVTLTKSDISLGNVDNTSDASKPISTATQTALDTAVHLASDETVTGHKTFVPVQIFTNGIVLPDGNGVLHRFFAASNGAWDSELYGVVPTPDPSFPFGLQFGVSLVGTQASSTGGGTGLATLPFGVAFGMTLIG